MDVLELKDTTHFLRDFGDIHRGISSHSQFDTCVVQKKVRGPEPILK